MTVKRNFSRRKYVAGGVDIILAAHLKRKNQEYLDLLQLIIEL